LGQRHPTGRSFRFSLSPALLSGYIHLAVADHDVAVTTELAEALIGMHVRMLGVEEVPVGDDEIHDRVLVAAEPRVPAEYVEYLGFAEPSDGSSLLAS
jgi:hypothetical protein